MKRRRFRWLLIIPLAVLITPLLLWALIVLVAPTSWARSHVIAALKRASGRSVQLDELNVCLGGGIELTNLRIGAPQAVRDPWLQAPKLQIDVSLLQLLRGKFEPTFLAVEGATLRVLRREDGSLELSDLVQADTNKSKPASSQPHRCGVSKLRAKIQGATIYVLDQPSKTMLEFKEVCGEGIWEGEGAFVATLSGELNQGPFQFTAHFDRSARQPRFEGQVRASDVALDQGMSVLRYLVPALAGAQVQLKGKLALDVYLRGNGLTRESLCRTLTGHGNISLDPVELAGTPLLVEYSKLAGIPQHAEVGSVRSDFLVKDGRITTDRMILTAGRVPLVVGGWTDFTGHLDYQAKLEGVAEHLPEMARKFISKLDLDLNQLTSLRLTGTVDKVAVKLEGRSADGRVLIDQMMSRDDQERLKVLGRRLRDKLLR